MLAVYLLIFVYSANLNVQTMNCNTFNCSNPLSKFLINQQSISRIVNNQYDGSPADSHPPGDLSNILQPMQLNGIDAAYFHGTIDATGRPNSATYTLAESNTYTLLKNPQSSLPPIPVTVMQRKNPTLNNIKSEILVTPAKYTYGNVQDLHIHHHILHLKPEKETPKTQSFHVYSHNKKLHIQNNSTNGNKDVQMWDKKPETTASREYTLQELIKSKIKNALSVNNPVFLTKTNNITNFLPNTDKDRFANSSNCAVTQSCDEHTAYGVPLN